MSKLILQDNTQNKQFKPRIYQGKWRGQSRYNYDQGNYQNRYRSNSRDRRTSFRCRGQYRQNYREDHVMLIIIEKTTGKTILEKCKITEVNILEVDIEGIIEMTTLKEVEVGLGTHNIQVTLEGMTEVIVGQDQVQESVLTETELDALSVRNMIILLKTAQTETEKEPEQQIQKNL